MRRVVGVLFVAVAASGCTDEDRDGTPAWRDCDDADPLAFVGGTEGCDGVDNDCDGHVDEEVSILAYQDRDGDGAGDPARARRVCAMPADGVAEAGDCDDLDPSAHPGAPETCDGRDDDCDGEIDEGVTATFWPDADGDGHGVDGASVVGCTPPAGYARAKDDCDDAEPLAWAGAQEWCDGVDNDCDDAVDEDAVDGLLWVDADGDGFGDPERPAGGCGVVPGLSADPRDCDDADAALHPGLADPGNGVDDDCDGLVDELRVPGDFPMLAAALTGAPDDAIVQLAPGLYVGDFVVDRPITLAGDGCDRTVLFGAGGATVTLSGGAGLSDLTVTAGALAGVQVAGKASLARVCVTGNSNVVSGGGIDLARAATLTLTDVSVVGNVSANDGGGIHADVDSVVDATRLQLIDNHAKEGGGLMVRSSAVTVVGAVIAGNSATFSGGGVKVDRSSGAPRPSLALSHASVVGNRLTWVPGPTDVLDNNRGSGVYGSGASDLVLSHVLFADQGPADREVLYVLAGGTLAVDQLGLWRNGALELRAGYDRYAARGEPAFLAFDADGDPRAWDLRLGVRSAFRDAGDAAVRDPDGSVADVGAFGGPVAAGWGQTGTWDGGTVGDLDHDGLPDAWERAVGLLPWADDADEDPDADGLTHADERIEGTDPWSADSDGDGVDDGDELGDGTDPRNPLDRVPVVVVAPVAPGLSGDEVVVDASASAHPLGGPVAYQWTLVASPGGASLSSATDAAPTLTLGAAGEHVLRVTVSAGGASATRDVVARAWDGVVVPDDMSAVDAFASAEPVILLRPGTYAGHLTVTNRALAVVGLGAGATIDAGGLDHVVEVRGAVGRVELVNVTLTDGSAARGGGVLCIGCDGTDLSAPGCAVTLDAAYAALTLDRVRVVDNVASLDGGGVSAELCTVKVSDSVFAGNGAATGGGVALLDSPATFARTRFSANRASSRGGGLHADPSDHVVTGDALVFDANTAPDGAAVWWDGDGDVAYMGRLHGAAFLGNDGAGAAVTVYQGRLATFGALVGDNTTGWGFDAASNAHLFALYPVLWGNVWRDGGDDWRTPGGEPRVVHRMDPQLVVWSADEDVDNDVFSLAPGSPLRDSGFPEWKDLDGSRAGVGPSAGASAAPLSWLDGVDLDLDGMSDGWEWRHGLDRTADDAGGDPDGDGRDNADELAAGTDPRVAD